MAATRGSNAAPMGGVGKRNQRGLSGSGVMRLKDFLRREQAIQRRWKTSINRHLHDDFNDLIARDSNVQSRGNMDLELRRCMAHRGERRDGCDLAGADVKTGSRVDIAERKLEQILGEVRRDVGEPTDDFFARR